MNSVVAWKDERDCPGERGTREISMVESLSAVIGSY